MVSRDDVRAQRGKLELLLKEEEELLDVSFLERWECWSKLCLEIPVVMNDRVFMLASKDPGTVAVVVKRPPLPDVRLTTKVKDFPSREFLGKLLLCME